MHVLRDLLLALIQGVSEIYPVSSTGHVIVAGAIMGIQPSFQLLLLLHLGSALAIAVYYKRSILEITSGRLGKKLPLYMLLSFVTTAILGLSMRSFAIDLTGRPITAARFWLLNFAVLFVLAIISRSGNRELRDLTWIDLFALGVAQAFGILPGISRLGLTLGVALIRRMKWSEAIRISFLLSLPVMLTAAGWQMLEPLLHTPLLQIPAALSRYTLAAATQLLSTSTLWYQAALAAVAFVASLLTLRHLSRYIYLGRKLLIYFSLYCLINGLFFAAYLRLL